MTSNAPQACCVSGFKHEGESVGSYETLNGVKCYVSYPPDRVTQNAIVYLPDAFGFELVNSRLLADDLARAGYFVVIPDVFRGNPAPDFFSFPEEHKKFDVPAWLAWLAKHPVTTVDSVIEAVVKELRANKGVKRIGSVGYCIGGKYVVRFLAEGRGVDAGFIAHPSLMEAREVKEIVNPLSIAAPEMDSIFPAEKRRETEDILFEKKVPYQVCLYGDSEHGFAVRANLKDRKQKFVKESAYIQAVRWFDEWVKDADVKGKL